MLVEPIPFEVPLVRYMVKKTGATPTACLNRLRAEAHNVQQAVRALAPDAARLKYVDYYYAQALVRVDDSRLDIPCAAFLLEMPSYGDRLTADQDDGERLIAPFNDNNSFNEIAGLLMHLASFPTYWDEEEIWVFPTVQGALMEVQDRLYRKLRAPMKPTQSALFREAIEALRAAAGEFVGGDDARGRQLVERAEDLTRRGQEAKRERN